MAKDKEKALNVFKDEWNKILSNLEKKEKIID